MARTLRMSLVALFVLAFGAWVFFAPYLTVRSMRLAAEAGDAEAFSRYVDYPALRESVKAELSEAMGARIADLAGSSALGRFGAQIAGAFGDRALGPAVDALVRPEALTALFAGRGIADEYTQQRVPLIDGDNAAASGSSAAPTQSTDSDNASQRGDDDLSGFDIAGTDIRATIGYEGFGRFAVNVDEPQSGRRIVLILTRDKLLWWKLSAVELPDG